MSHFRVSLRPAFRPAFFTFPLLLAAGACQADQATPAAATPAELIAAKEEPDLDAPGFAPLFNGKDLTGWQRRNGGAAYAVKDGAIVGTCDPKSRLNTFLCTERSDYADFVFTTQVKFEVIGNSGLMFRAQQKKAGDGAPDGRVFGYQCEVDDGDGKEGRKERRFTGGIYDEARRAWLFEPKGEAFAAARAAFKYDGWNRITIACVGHRLRTWVNGVAVADYTDSDPKGMDKQGFFGLQVHAGKQGTIHWKDIKVRELK